MQRSVLCVCVYFKPSSSFDAMQETFFQIRCFAAMVKQNNNMENDIIGKSNIKKYVEHQMKKARTLNATFVHRALDEHYTSQPFRFYATIK